MAMAMAMAMALAGEPPPPGHGRGASRDLTAFWQALIMAHTARSTGNGLINKPPEFPLSFQGWGAIWRPHVRVGLL